MRYRTVILPALALLLAMPASAERISEPAANQAVMAVVEAFNRALHAKDAAGIANLYTQDAVRVAPDGPQNGRADIQKVWTAAFKVYDPDFAKMERVVVVGDDAFLSYGDFAGTFHSPNGPVALKGYAVWAYAREAGQWKIRLETWNERPTP